MQAFSYCRGLWRWWQSQEAFLHTSRLKHWYFYLRACPGDLVRRPFLLQTSKQYEYLRGRGGRSVGDLPFSPVCCCIPRSCLFSIPSALLDRSLLSASLLVHLAARNCCSLTTVVPSLQQRASPSPCPRKLATSCMQTPPPPPRLLPRPGSLRRRLCLITRIMTAT